MRSAVVALPGELRREMEDLELVAMDAADTSYADLGRPEEQQG